MTDFNYAHKNTEKGERATKTAPFNKPQLGEEIQALRQSAFKAEIPVSDDETLCFLQTFLSTIKPENILELGTAVGVSGAVMLQTCTGAHLTTVERDENFYNTAVENFNALNLASKVTAVFGDAGEEILKLPENAFDFIFLDSAKVQYIKYLPRLKKLLKSGGVLVADDILLFGYITGEEEVPKKRKMLVEHIKEYLTAVTNDKELYTTVLDIGNGVAVSVKK